MVDDADYELVSRYRWNLWDEKLPGRDCGPYAIANTRRADGRKTTIRMHCLVMGKLGIDHADGNGLNNQRENLRVATKAQNGQNRRPNIGSSSQFKGVSWNARDKRWHARIRVAGVLCHLGYFKAEEDAARAYDFAAAKAFGSFALLNFQERSQDALRDPARQGSGRARHALRHRGSGSGCPGLAAYWRV